MLIEYDPSTINFETPTVEAQKNTTPDDIVAGNNIFIPSWEISDVLYYDPADENKGGRVVGKVFGDTTAFSTNNSGNYITLTELPTSGNIKYCMNMRFNPVPKTENDVFKGKARDRVHTEVGDIFDILADIAKRQTMGERLVLLLAKEIFDNDPDLAPVSKARYQTLVDSYKLIINGAIDSGSPIDLADIEDPMELFTKLISRTNKVTEIVMEEYITKKS